MGGQLMKPQVRALKTAEEFRRYFDFGQEVYRDNPYWAPSDADHLSGLLGGKGPFEAQAHVQAFLVEEDGRAAATMTAVIDEEYNRRWDERMGHLFFFEALPDREEAVAALFQASCDWLRDRGCRAVRTPFLPGWQLGFTIDAYDEVPTIFHSFNPSYYHSYIKNGGFVTECGVVQYQIQFTSELAQRYVGMVERVESNGVKLRPFDFDRLPEETEIFTKLYNETFRSHWGFMPLPVGVMRELTVELKDFLVPEFTGFAEIDGKEVGFVYSLPDLNQVLHRMKGKPIEENAEEFQRGLEDIDHGVLLVIGVKEEFRGRGVNLALAARSYLAMIERGYKTGSYTVVLDDNRPSRRTAEKLGGRVTRNFIVYRKELV
jgi:GNAT superfamily N-acetyltransferase